MAHELNNPASAVLRGAKQMQSAYSDLQSNQLQLYTNGLSQPQLDVLAKINDQCQEPRAGELSSLERSDREVALETWLDMPNAWEYTDALVELGYTTSDLESLLSPFNQEQRPLVLGWIKSSFLVYGVMREVGQGAEQISHLVKSLKSYTYLDQAPIQVVDIHEGLENTLIMLRSKLKTEVTVHREFMPTSPRIQAYGSELNQVWTNIIDNAIDAMNGKGDLTIRTYKKDQWIVVEIEDNGVGIPPEVAGKIFDPFFTTKPLGSGTGLGLNISHNIITQKHKGQIKVLSGPGKTCFQVKLRAI
jgi:signal transduction histidine kinase